MGSWLPSSIARKMPADHSFPLDDCRSTSKRGNKRLSNDFLPADGPKCHPPFDDDEGLIHGNGHYTNNNERGKDKRNVEATARDHHQIPDARISGDSLSHDRTNEGQRDRHLQRSKEVRHRPRNSKFSSGSAICSRPAREVRPASQARSWRARSQH